MDISQYEQICHFNFFAPKKLDVPRNLDYEKVPQDYNLVRNNKRSDDANKSRLTGIIKFYKKS